MITKNIQNHNKSRFYRLLVLPLSFVLLFSTPVVADSDWTEVTGLRALLRLLNGGDTEYRADSEDAGEEYESRLLNELMELSDDNHEEADGDHGGYGNDRGGNDSDNDSGGNDDSDNDSGDNDDSDNDSGGNDSDNDSGGNDDSDNDGDDD